MVRNTKEEQVDRLDLLYDPTTLEQIRNRYGNAMEIKAAVKTSAKVYEIRTALRYWFGGANTHRTNDALWKKIRVSDEDGLEPEEADRL